MPIFYVLAFIAGGGLGFAFFYFRYQYKDAINELRSNLKDANQQIQYLQGELEEFLEQNEILRSKTTELLDKNDELNDVVAELSKYYVHIKKASEKSSELSSFLREPDPDLEEKINKYSKKDRTGGEKKFF
ncbi:hypothetical protein AGMMS50249_6250 [candidate division SR1 bacterium]|nr:hypothetical protein AGMMS50249_6250 [candidate division SR1 bacterium]